MDTERQSDAAMLVPGRCPDGPLRKAGKAGKAGIGGDAGWLGTPAAFGAARLLGLPPLCGEGGAAVCASGAYGAGGGGGAGIRGAAELAVPRNALKGAVKFLASLQMHETKCAGPTGWVFAGQVQVACFQFSSCHGAGTPSWTCTKVWVFGDACIRGAGAAEALAAGALAAGALDPAGCTHTPTGC